MGNQLVAISPSQIFPVEHYLTELGNPDIKYEMSLGSTRFLKVVRAETTEGLIVVKVFAIHDPSLPLTVHKERLEEIRVKLAPAVNCLPFHRLLMFERAGFIMREYVKYSLYDRISTRPFLTSIEKRWITFQILYALHQCHKVGVCHGDIKLENITVTSWNWVLLVDFASFKPTYLPDDNPADYSYFFDTSRRRICYIAPERFVKPLNTETNSMFETTGNNNAELKPAMDIFAAGCALLEFWNEGHTPFELSQLLAYRTGEYSPQKHLDKLEDQNLNDLISSMIQKDPKDRLSAEVYLSQQRGKLFPEYFYSFLQSYMLMFSSSPIISADEKINRLKSDIGNIFKFLCANGDTSSDNTSGDNTSDMTSEEVSPDTTDDTTLAERDVAAAGGVADDSNGLVIIVTLVTSTIRGLHDCSSKLQTLEILYELAIHANEETILDRILPFLLFFVQDQNSRVKSAAVDAVTKCLAVVKVVPRSDTNVFPEYIFPALLPLVTDASTNVRVAYARNIADLSDTASRFLEYAQAHWCDRTAASNGETKFNFESELQTLHEIVQTAVSGLLSDAASIVKQTLLDKGITKLCVFFGKKKSNDIILSHVITYLNDKDDAELRGTFYDCMPGVAAFIGNRSTCILNPLLVQGFNDSSEFVTAKAIHAVAALAELALLDKRQLTELINESAIFLIHPNLWIRQALVRFYCTCAATMSLLDVQVKIVKVIQPYLRHSIIQVSRPELLLEVLKPAIPRIVYDSIITFKEIHSLLDKFKERQKFRDTRIRGIVDLTGDVQLVKNVSNSEPETIVELIRRLEAIGLTDEIEEYFLAMEAAVLKINKHRLLNESNNVPFEGKIEIGEKTVKSYSYTFNASRGVTNVRRQSETSRSTSSRPSSPATAQESSHSQLYKQQAAISLHERSYIEYRTASCGVNLRALIAKQEDHYLEALRTKELAEQTRWNPPIPPPGWRLTGNLVAHLHEHRASVTRILPIPETPLFASGSMDGTVRLWDCSKMEGKNLANRSKTHFAFPPDFDGVNAMTVCENGHSLTAAAQNATLSVLRLETLHPKVSPLQTRILTDEEGTAVIDVQCLNSGSQNVLVYGTLNGHIVGWDLRQPGAAFRLRNDLNRGVVTCFCLDKQQNWLALGTNIGNHVLWDLRFQLQIGIIECPHNDRRIRRMVTHPTEPSWILSSTQFNNEVTMWNMETSYREKVLWASGNPPFSNVKPSTSVYALLTGCVDRSGFVLAAGSDQRLRYWNLENPMDSYIPIYAPNDPYLTGTVTYEMRTIDGTDVVQEIAEAPQPDPTVGAGRADEVPRAGPEQPPAGHLDCINDIALCKTSQCFLLTASRRGVIKVWK